jgi:hypothetical protein
MYESQLANWFRLENFHHKSATREQALKASDSHSIQSTFDFAEARGAIRSKV